MKKVLSVSLLGLLLFAVVFFVVQQRGEKESGTVVNDSQSMSGQVIARVPDEVVYVTGSEEFVADLHSDEIDPEGDLEILQNLLFTYRQVFGSNPQGGLNVEIAERLLGRNERKARFLPESFSFLNREGELIDRWGSPYFFHPVSAEMMEIVSAGPDRKLWTDDDVTIQ